MHPYLPDKLVGLYNAADLVFHPEFADLPQRVPIITPPVIVSSSRSKKKKRTARQQQTVTQHVQLSMLQVPEPVVQTIPRSIATPKAPPLLLFPRNDLLTYGNVAIWLSEQPPRKIVGRRRRLNECVLQQYLNEHGGAHLPMALEPWAFTFEYTLNTQDPVASLVTSEQALRALRDPMTIKAIGWGDVPDELLSA